MITNGEKRDRDMLTGGHFSRDVKDPIDYVGIFTTRSTFTIFVEMGMVIEAGKGSRFDRIISKRKHEKMTSQEKNGNLI